METKTKKTKNTASNWSPVYVETHSPKDIEEEFDLILCELGQDLPPETYKEFDQFDDWILKVMDERLTKRSQHYLARWLYFRAQCINPK